jgi:hypothetical protein
MNTQHEDRTAVASLTDLDIVCRPLSERIAAAASSGTGTIRESFIHRHSHSHAEFAAACELAEGYGLAVH